MQIHSHIIILLARIIHCYSLHMLMNVMKYVFLYTFHQIGLCSFILYRNHFTNRTYCAISERLISTLIRNKRFGKDFLTYLIKKPAVLEMNRRFNIYTSLYTFECTVEHTFVFLKIITFHLFFWLSYLSSVVGNVREVSFYSIIFVYLNLP